MVQSVDTELMLTWSYGHLSKPDPFILTDGWSSPEAKRSVSNWILDI